MKTIVRRPTSPGEILREEFLKPLALTQKQLAEHLSCNVKMINRIVNDRSAVTANMAVRLAATFGTTPGFWLNAQQAVDLYQAMKRVKSLPRSLLTLVGQAE